MRMRSVDTKVRCVHCIPSNIAYHHSIHCFGLLLSETSLGLVAMADIWSSRIGALDPHVMLGKFFEAASAPALVLTVIKVVIVSAAIFMVIQVIRWSLQATPANPFKVIDYDKVERKAYVFDADKRNAVLALRPFFQP